MSAEIELAQVLTQFMFGMMIFYVVAGLAIRGVGLLINLCYKTTEGN